MKQDVLIQLTALRATVRDKDDGHRVDEAIDRLAKSVDPNLWSNSTDPDEKKDADKIFNEEKDAANKLSSWG